MGIQVEISQPAYRKLVTGKIADRLYNLYHDRHSTVPVINDGENVPAILQDCGVHLQEQLELDNNLCGFRRSIDTRLALGAFWMGEYPYDNRSSWRRGRMKTTVSAEDSNLVIAQQSVDVDDIYVISNPSKMSVAQNNWPAFVYIAAQFAKGTIPQRKLQVVAAEWCELGGEEVDIGGLAEYTLARTVASGGKTTPLTDHNSIQLPYVFRGNLSFATRNMEQDDWIAYDNNETLTFKDAVTFSLDESLELFLAAIRFTGLPHKAVAKIVEEAYA